MCRIWEFQEQNSCCETVSAIHKKTPTLIQFFAISKTLGEGEASYYEQFCFYLHGVVEPLGKISRPIPHAFHCEERRRKARPLVSQIHYWVHKTERPHDQSKRCVCLVLFTDPLKIREALTLFLEELRTHQWPTKHLQGLPTSLILCCLWCLC